MPGDPQVFLDDIVDACGKIERYIEGSDLQRFRSDEKTLDAVIRNLEVIGQAAKKLPLDIRRAMPAVEWQRIAGLRDVLIHEYFGIDVEIVWDVVTTRIPALRDTVRQHLLG